MGSATTFLGRLRRDISGNTLAIMAAALIPLMGFAGSAVDFARIYVVKVRLQQACDAGALAGRKAMTDTTAPPAGQTLPLDSAASAQATTFFNNNFPAGWYKTNNISFVPVKTVSDSSSTVANVVQGTATVTLPMVVMNFFGINSRDLQATCQARFDVADADIMFVLDTTGSMSCYPSDPDNCSNTPLQPYTRSDGTTGYANPEKPQTTDGSGNAMYSKIESLRQAVLLFDTTMRANADTTTHFRYGFVTYTSAVNVGGIIPAGYLQNTTWTYQSRHLSPTVDPTSNTAGDYNYGGPFPQSITGVPQAYCPVGSSFRIPAAGFVRANAPYWNDEGYYEARWYSGLSWTASNGGTCSGTAQRLRALWRYEPTALDVSGYVKTLGASAPSVLTPGRLDGLTSKWRGCIEEVNTTTASSFDVNNLPDDLNPDFKPTAVQDKWRPIWSDAEWLRSNLSGPTEQQDDQINEATIPNWESYTYRTGSILDQSGSASCGMAAQRLQVMTAQQVHDYVYATDFKPAGGTYHDTGMIWGTRMLSPDSVFGDSTAWPGHNPPTRNIVFMTDGTMSPSLFSYGQYGVEYWDARVTGGDFNNQYNRHIARFRVECDAAKKKGMNIYVVALGTAANPDITYCASPGQVFTASSTTALTNAFKQIAQRVAMLRIVQ